MSDVGVAATPARRRIDQPMLRERAYDEFKRRLFLGHLRPGQFVSQREIADLVGLPLAPVRDAVKRLEAEGLLRIIPQRGISVAEVNVRLVREAFELRAALETFAARRFPGRRDGATIAAIGQELKDLVAVADRSLSDTVADAVVLADWRLHEEIVAALDNEIYRDAHRHNFDRIRLIRMNRRYTLDRLRQGVAEHLAIIAALLAGDGEAAASAVQHHLDVAMRRSIGLDG
jgi:DNA-binding GntR family transcriptional regulator